MGLGLKGHVTVDFQDSYGTAQTSSLEPIPIISESVVHAIDVLAERGMYGRLDESPHHQGPSMNQGAIEVQAHPIAMGIPLKSVLGNVTTTSDTAKQIHSFKPAASDFDGGFAPVPPFTAEIHRDVGSAGQYYDMVGNQCTLNIAAGEIMGLTWNVLGGGFTRAAAGSPTFVNAKPFQWSQFSGSLDGVAFSDLRRLQIRHDNAIQAEHTNAGTRSPNRFARSNFRMIEVTGQAIFLVHSSWDVFLSGSEFPLVGYFTGAESPNSFKFDIPALRFKTFEPKMTGPGRVLADFTAQAMYHTGSATAIEYTLENTKTYY